MSTFVPPAVVTDPFQIAANAKAFLEAELPGWRLAKGSQVDLIIDALSFAAAEQAEALSVNLIAAYKSLGALVGVVPIRPIPATASATFTLSDTAGHTILAANTIIGVRDASNELQTFRPVTDIIVAPGASTGTGTVEATEAGTAGNGLSGACELAAADAFVVSATLGSSGGGVGEEEEEAFLNRLTEQLALQKPGFVLAIDAASLARNVPGVGRATAVDNLKPKASDGGEGSEETGVEKCVTVALTNADGTPASAELLATVLASLQALREANFKVFVVKPHYTKIDVTTTVFAWPGENLVSVKEEVLAALKAYLSPANFAADSSARAANWRNDPKVRQGELFTAISNVKGVRWCSALTFGKHGGALATTDVILGEGSAVPALPDVLGNADGTSTPATFTITVEPST
jgi:uncharacterized phage protein gp47/JayE